MSTTNKISEKQQQLIDKLKELFQMDQADLDFGIYRIMNAKHDEIEKFLNNDLLPTIRKTLEAGGKATDAQKELDDTILNLQNAGVDPDTSPKVQELKALLSGGANVEKDEEEIFSHLYTFFSRYYDGGDFMSLRRYKKETFSPLPMNGEESKFHWANADQYYIKSAENFSSYAYVVGDDENKKRIQFELGDGSTEQNNVKSVGGRNRQFIIDAKRPISERVGDYGRELVIHFNYQSDPKKRKQKDISLAAIEFLRTLESNTKEAEAISSWDDWKEKLFSLSPTEKNTKRTVLEKYLTDYTAKNTFDYFIHKDLGGFLTRELDFYIKNEMLITRDIIPDNADSIEQQLLTNEAKLKKVIALKQIATKIVRFIAQLEDFQKKLWLKKKLVNEAHYCVTLDKLPAELYDYVCSNEAQHKEWLELFLIDELEGYSKPVTTDFLAQNQSLMIDTAFYDETFKETLLESFDDIDAEVNGVISHSDNYQALRLLKKRFKEEVKCVYIDPPYNTDVSSIPYKNNYRHSSWGTMMRDRIAELSNFMSEDAAIFVSIDKAERTMLEHNLDSVFGKENKVEELIWIQNTNDGRSPTYSTNHEYVEVYSKRKAAVEADFNMFREPKPGCEEVMHLIRELNSSYPPVIEIQNSVRALYSEHRKNYRAEVEDHGLDWEVEQRNNPWKGIYNYNKAEYRDDNGKFVDESLAREVGALIWVWQEDNWTIMSSDSKQSGTTKDPNHKNFRYYEPIHPVTGKPVRLSSRGWKGTQYIDPEYLLRNSFESLNNDHRIAWGVDENKVPRQKRFLHEVETNVCKSVFTDYSDGEKETTALFGKSGVFLAPKHTKFVRRFIEQVSDSDSYVLDCFGGSGSSGDAVIKQNREDGGTRKYILAEMGHHFDTILKPRLLKTVYSNDWKAGKPISREGLSHVLKYVRLESYEDALDNISLSKNETQKSLIEKNRDFREQYVLSYMLDIESQGSLINLDQFVDPFNVAIKVTRNEESFQQRVNLVETFNYLLGLRVKTMRRSKGVYEVAGLTPEGQSALILWRNTNDTSNDTLDAWFKKQSYNSRDMEFDLIYVNGDNNLPNLRTGDESWKVQLIEDAFHTLMFDVKDV